MRKRVLTMLLSALLLAGCADAESSSLSEREKYESALEEYTENENPYAFLPDGVRMDDSEHISELSPDGEGNIGFDKLGVKLPYAGRTYIYERSPWNVKEYNYFCSAAMFVTNEFFPEVTDYVMISYYTDLEPVILTYDDAKVRWPEELLNTVTPTEEAYLAEVRAELDKMKNYLAAHEVMYDYNFFGLPKGTYTSDPSDDDFKSNAAASPDMHFLGISSVSGTGKALAPESYHTEPSAEMLELENGCYAVRIKYQQVRYGVECSKEVYWVYHKGGVRLHRIEFSHDTRAGEAAFDPQTFLASIELTDPSIKDEGGADQNYFGDPPGTEHFDELM